MRAGGDSNHPARRMALETLCSMYWLPLYKYAQYRVGQIDLAQDLTQSFFERLLSGSSLKLADPARGRFRTFLVQAFDWHLANDYREKKRFKRGGTIKILPLDFSLNDCRLPDSRGLTGEQLFEREWAMTLLSVTMERLRTEQIELNKLAHFEILKQFLTGEGVAGGYAAACEKLTLNESAARMAVSRLRARYRELLREEILKTIASSDDLDDEIRQLFRALSLT